MVRKARVPMGMINLYVDDLRMPPAGYHLARTYEEAVAYFENQSIDVLSLDFDFGFDERGRVARNGMDLVQYICEHRLKVNRILLHSSSPYGRKKMHETLIHAKNKGLLDPELIIEDDRSNS